MLTLSLSNKYLSDEFVIQLFTPWCDASKLSVYGGINSEFVVLVYRCKDISNLTEMHKQVLLTKKKILRLMCTIIINTSSNERIFGKLRLIKNYLRYTMYADRLQHLMLLT